jgi:hypothetical protein
MVIRMADVQQDYDKVWDIFSNVIRTGDTYVFDPDTPKESLSRNWFADYMNTFVAKRFQAQKPRIRGHLHNV